jgi:hypothetical protein
LSFVIWRCISVGKTQNAVKSVIAICMQSVLALGTNAAGGGHALSRLRSALNDPLFYREGHRMCPSVYASQLARRRQLLIEKFQRRSDRGRQLAGIDAGTHPVAFAIVSQRLCQPAGALYRFGAEISQSGADAAGGVCAEWGR